METLQLANQTVNLPILANTTTKAELLSRAKDGIESGETSFRVAADALALAKENFDATQREMAEAVGRSASWVNRLLKWQRSGYKEYSPFGPTTQAGRVSHAQQSARASTRKPGIEADADDPEDNGEKRKAVYAKLYPDVSSTDTKPTTCTDAKASAHALGEFKYAVDAYVPKMDDAAKQEATAYFLKKAGVEMP